MRLAPPIPFGMEGALDAVAFDAYFIRMPCSRSRPQAVPLLDNLPVRQASQVAAAVSPVSPGY